MGKIIISTNASLDGVVQDPDGAEGLGLGDWFTEFMGPDRAAWAAFALEETRGTAALLLGRRSDEWFATRWQSRAGVWADLLNGLPKYVVSAAPEPPRWSNGTLLSGDLVTQMTKLKQEVDGDIIVYASYQLGQALLEHDLVDEVRLVVLPVVLGVGARLFGPTGAPKPLRLTSARPLGDGLALLTYQVVKAQ
jgi:dihydrofolate reductase